MGSLLKEYLNLTQKQDAIANSSENNNEKPTNTEEKGTSDNTPDSEDSTYLELENSKGTSGCLDDSCQGLDNQPQNSCTSESGTTSVSPFKNVVAIVDPPRVGLHPTVIKALRTHPHLRRLVYISCNPESLVANAIELCTPSANKTEKGNKNNWGWRNMSSAGLARHRAKSMPASEPFRPIKAMASYATLRTGNASGEIYVIVLTFYGYMNISLILWKHKWIPPVVKALSSGLLRIMLAWTGLASQLSGLLSSVPRHAAIFGGNPQLFSEQLPLRWLWLHSYLAKTGLTLLWIFVMIFLAI
ncbi:zinc finger (CCCH-type) family protein [Actinidia rufa]|uniref:Zinc finger (CCCH-type) family protein n=1 Tax=Actinidia rufa TaxID=165716 RepID=A0A7J0H4F9_9ERIC|nr:zinc finger (CCCH-type) family protein [Actinidia rufa]